MMELVARRFRNFWLVEGDLRLLVPLHRQVVRNQDPTGLQRLSSRRGRPLLRGRELSTSMARRIKFVNKFCGAYSLK